MAGSTWVWNGGSALASSANWTLTSGPGNSHNGPQAGDTAIIPDGTVVTTLDPNLEGSTIEIGGTVGTIAAITFSGDTLTTIASPSIDNATVMTSAVPGQTTSEITVLNTGGIFINEGSIVADGPAGSVFTINIAQTTVGTTTVPGTFINYGQIEVTAGNTLDIAIGANAELLNAGQIDVDGGYLDLNIAPGAINGGYAPISDVAIVSNGGTLETNVTYGTTQSGVSPYYAFTDTTEGNTVKIDNIQSFGGRFLGFGVGDTIDLGTSLTVTSLSYNPVSGLLYLENGGVIVDTLLFAAGDYSGGAVTGTIAAGSTATAGTFGLTLGADGDTELVSTAHNDLFNNASGVWQNGSAWSTGTPGTLDTAIIGLDSSAAFTLTTGSTPVSVGDIVLAGTNGLLQITSATTVNDYSIQSFAGTLQVTSGNTLTVPLLRTFGGLVELDSGAVLNATGHVNYGSGSLTYFGSVNGTLAISNTNTGAVSIGGGTLLVDGGTIDAGGFFEVGYAGSGTPAQATIEATGSQHAVVTDTYALISSDLVSFGELTLDGNVTWTDAGDSNDLVTRGYMIVGGNQLGTAAATGSLPGPSGTALLLVENGASLTETDGAQVGSTPNSAGSVTIESGGVWNVGSAGLGVGYAGSGTLDVLNGGTVEIGSTGLSTGHSLGAQGTLLVSGAGALLTNSGGWADGKAGQGFAQILNGGSILMSGTSGLTIGESLASSGTLVVGGPGSTASAIVTLGTLAAGLSVGDLGSGTLDVLSDGTIELDGTHGLGIGTAAAGGLVLVSGSGALISLAPSTNGVGIGNTTGASGTLDIQNGGTLVLDSTNNSFNVGHAAGASGTVIVGDGLLTIGTTANGFNVGVTGTGTVDLMSGGTIVMDGTKGLVIGGASASGQVVVSGPGALLSDGATSSGIFVGTGGTGSLQVEDNGTVLDQGQGLVIGENAGSNGTVSVSDGTFLMQNTGFNVTVGGTGHGLLDIGNAGTFVSSGGLVVGASAGSGTVTVAGGTLTVQGSVSGSGGIGIAELGLVQLDGSVSAVPVAFNDSTGILEIGAAAFNHFDAVVQNFQSGNTIIVDSPAVTGLDYNSGTLDVLDGGTTLVAIDLPGPFTTNSFTHSPDGGTATFITENALCFLSGTLIGTPSGQTAVERLAAGDLVRTASGQIRPIAWIGHGRVLATRGRRGPATPVIVRKAALGPNVPHTDLRVTKGHSFLVDDMLIPVEFLVNHRSILWDDRAQEVSVYHVELETHDVLVANGAPAESYRDDGNRWLFQNANAGWDQPAKAPCAQVVTGGPVVDAVWRRLLDACGPRPSVPLTEDPDLHLLVDGVRVQASARTGDALVFALPPATGAVRVMSRAAVPQELGLARDARLLGVALRRVAVRQGTRFRTFRADDALLTDGFHAFEPGTGLRWTDGDATMPAALFDGFPGACELVVQLGGTATYVDDGDQTAVA